MVSQTVIVRWFAQPIIAILVGITCLEGANLLGWYPERQLAHIARDAFGSLAEDIARWLLRALLSVAIWFIEDRFILYRGGQGGRGGNARVGGSGIAIGGPGGQAGKYGKGGAGGGGVVAGDGIAAGGTGGSAGDDGVWRAPAKSGYEIYQREMGLPVDPDLRQFGRGGAMPGYEPKLQVIEKLRAQYFGEHNQVPRTIFEDINAVPLGYLNEALAAKNEQWRVRIVHDEYEFFIPGKG